jgi:glycosyltransferase involved in cell wall biosynthesis
LEGYPFPILKSQYPQIDVIKEPYTPNQLAELLQKSDCFVFPSRGEGFGLPPLEALSTGTPVIVPNAHGIAEYFTRNYFFEVETKKEIPALYDRFRGVDVGKMFEPDVDSLRRQMRFIYEHRSYAFDIARKGASWVKDAYTWEKTARALVEVFKEFKKKEPQPLNVILEPSEEVELEEDKIIFLTEDTQHITGGRYYSWWLATAIQASGQDVIIYTNRQPVFLDEFKDYPQPEVRIVKEIAKVNVKGKAYVGSPIVGNLAAVKLGEKFNKPTFVEIFDPFPMMSKYRGNHNWQGWDELLKTMKKPHVKIISLCETTSFYIYEWLNKTKKQVLEVNPCVNSKERDKVPQQEKQNWITFISRLDFHKKLDHVLEALKDTDCELHVITSIDGIQFPKMVREHGLTNRVIIHKFVSDKEKFEIIKKSKAVINAAIFEGFGIWLTEALSCGVPVVCYDYPTFKEIAEKIDKKHRKIYFAKYNDPKDLKKQLQKALKDEDFTKGTKNFDFEVMVDRVKEVFEPEPKIGVITIALNEEEYIGASLRSVIKQKNVAKVAVVEGCVSLNESQATTNGLSKDNTAQKVLEVVGSENGNKIVYDKYGWAGSKSELRNRALQLLGREMDYIMVVDADEVWKTEDFEKLVKFIKKNKDASIVWYPAYHFWKQKDLIAVGSQWDAYLFRFFKYEDKSLYWLKHECPVVNENGDCVSKLGKEAKFDSIHFYHYGAMKPEEKIKAKLEYYAKRDKDLKVKDTWSNWKKGKDTQWTHGGGTVAKFEGKHPIEVLDLWKKQS